MKRSKLSIGLVTTFIASMALTACGSVTKSSTSIVDFTGYDGTVYNIATDLMYADFTNSDNITKFYSNILEVMIRNEFNKEDSALSKKKSLATIQQQAASKVKEQKEKAKENKKTNGTSYKTEWNKILDSYGVENAKELKEYFIYEIEKETAEDWYYDEFKEYLTKEYIGITDDGAAYDVESANYPYLGGDDVLNSKLPYHVRHILVEAGSDKTDWTSDTIEESQASKLYEIVDLLRDGNLTFGQIAAKGSDSAKDSYGDLSIIPNTASSGGSLTMVAEFQLGLYAYDALLGRATVNTAINNGLGLNGTYEDGAEKDEDEGTVKVPTISEYVASSKFALGTDSGIAGLVCVPVSVFDMLNEYKDVTTAKSGYNLADGKAQIYPRNILWNKYLNRITPFIITNNKTVDSSSTPTTWKDEDFNAIDWANTDSSYEILTTERKCGFRSASYLGLTDLGDTGVLTDENQNVIIGIRSQYGIHFVVVQKSIYDFAQGGSDVETVSLEEYYTTAVPGDDDFPTYNGKDKATYVNFINKNETTYADRASTVKTAIKGYDSTYEYRLFEELFEMNEDNFDLSDNRGKEMIEAIQQYIVRQRESKVTDQEKYMNRAWSNFLNQVDLQNSMRSNSYRTIPEGCIVGFNVDTMDDAMKAQYEEGGACYYGK